jgi:CRISPR-associated protein Cmx8
MARRAKNGTAKAKRRPSAAQDGPAAPIHLRYSLAELPSAQHRAGLAGLVLLAQWLERKPSAGTCTLTELDERGATLTLDIEGLRKLLDELYDATFEERPKSKRQKEKKGEEPAARLVVPKAAYVADRDPTSEHQGIWVKLWRDMLWNTLRAVPATREPFEARAAKRIPKDINSIWTQLTQQPDSAVELPSTYFLGAMSSTADNIPFKDRGRFQFLLHFWPYTAQIYVPQEIEVDEAGRARSRLSHTFALAIPDVSRLAPFCDAFHMLLRERETDVLGYRPREAVIDVPAESALDLAGRLHRRIARKEGGHATSSLVLGYEVFHLSREGNNVRILSTTRLVPTQSMTDEYVTLRHELWDPRFRRLRMVNLLAQKPWLTGFDGLLRSTPYEQTIGSSNFRHDVRLTLDTHMENLMQSESAEEAPSDEHLVYQLIANYVRQRVKSKYNLDWKTAQGDKAREADYNSAKAKVAKDAFLAVRSRTSDDAFINYFAGTLCSVPQYMKPESFEALSKALHRRTKEIRTLTLLALCANG